MCQQQQDPLQNGPVAVQLGLFAMVHSNLYYQFACKNKTAAIAEVSKCWLDIPLLQVISFGSRNHGRMGSTDASPDLTTSACSYIHYKPWTASLENSAKAGLYSQKVLVEFPSYQEATLLSVTYGNYLADGQCEMDGAASIPMYDLEMLAPGVANPLGAWARLKSWLKEWGDFLALCCILIFVFRCAADLCTVVAAALKAGPTVVITVG